MFFPGGGGGGLCPKLLKTPSWNEIGRLRNRHLGGKARSSLKFSKEDAVGKSRSSSSGYLLLVSMNNATFGGFFGRENRFRSH